MKCRHCESSLSLTLADLGSAPPSNAYLTAELLQAPETWFPLRVLVCQRCWLVQTEDFAQASELFNDEYAYFSSYSSTWLAHARDYVERMAGRFALAGGHHVIEIAANDGYLLQYVKNLGIPCLGIEPTLSTASAARNKGIPIITEFFGVELATRLRAEEKQADLMVANNVLAHVPNINDFVTAFAILLKPAGVATFEFPHLLNLLDSYQFDTIYHEHFSYLSLTAVLGIFARCGLTVFDVEELSTHGGSLRVYAQRTDTGVHDRCSVVTELLQREERVGLLSVERYASFQRKTHQLKNDFVHFLTKCSREGKSVAGYGAAAKGNTFLNYAGVRPDLLPFVVDRNPSKQGKYMPGSRIPIVDERVLREHRPDYVVLLPWNLKSEITKQLEYVRAWGGVFVTAIPRLEFA